MRRGVEPITMTDRQNVGVTQGLPSALMHWLFTVAHGDTCCSFCLAQKEAKAQKHSGVFPRSVSW